MRMEKKRNLARVPIKTQRELLRDVMLRAKECGAWLTLSELSAITRYPAASISAQLRHLKKPQFGNFSLEKRTREKGDIFFGQCARSCVGVPARQAKEGGMKPDGGGLLVAVRLQFARFARDTWRMRWR